MVKAYGLVDNAKRRTVAGAVRSFLVRLGAALSSDRGNWILVPDSDPVAGGRTARRVFRMRLAGDGVPVPDFAPGQYVFVSFPGRGILASPRAFTIASPPSEGRYLEVYGKDTDEWTGAAKLLAIGSSSPSGSGSGGGASPSIRSRVAGPFGRFSYLRSGGTGRFVFLAGGMGGVPFLSMLRFMADEDRDHRVLFLWGARTREDIFAAGELERAAERVRGFSFVPVFSHDPLWTGERGRIDQEKLERLVPAFFGTTKGTFEWNSASYWLCGPSSFEPDLSGALRRLGVGRAAIHAERFCV